MKRKNVLAVTLAALMAVTSLAGCGGAGSSETAAGGSAAQTTASGEKQDVALTVWGAEEDQTMLAEMIEAFKTAYADRANFTIELGVESEATCKDTILTDVEAAADVFAFADDQLNELVAAGALQEITLNPESVIEACGGADSGSVSAASKDGKLYAYPMTADNGYFMFYNKEYFTEEDVKTMDGMLAKAADAGKYVTMQLNEGWYLYSFFKGAGLSLELLEDGLNNSCNWNATDTPITGVDVTEGILEIAKNPGFMSMDDASFVSGLKDGTVIAGISGTWNAAVAEEAWGENYAACKLPTYTCAGQQVQMSSFAGYKLIGVNAYSDNAGWAMMLGEWLTNYDNQVTRFETRGLGPANVEAAASEAVQASPAIAALAAQSVYATVQRIGNSYWAPVQTFGAIMAAGNQDGTDLQTLLDNMVEGINAPQQ